MSSHEPSFLFELTVHSFPFPLEPTMEHLSVGVTMEPTVTGAVLSDVFLRALCRLSCSDCSVHISIIVMTLSGVF